MGAGPARERERSSRRDARDLGSSGLRCSVSETRCNGGAFRDRSSPASGPGHPSQMGGVRRRAKQCFATRLPHPWPLLVWPSLAKQLPPGTTIAPLTLQRHRHRSQNRPNHSTKLGLWELALQAKGRLCRPAGSQRRWHKKTAAGWPRFFLVPWRPRGAPFGQGVYRPPC